MRPKSVWANGHLSAEVLSGPGTGSRHRDSKAPIATRQAVSCPDAASLAANRGVPDAPHSGVPVLSWVPLSCPEVQEGMCECRIPECPWARQSAQKPRIAAEPRDDRLNAFAPESLRDLNKHHSPPGSPLPVRLNMKHAGLWGDHVLAGLLGNLDHHMPGS